MTSGPEGKLLYTDTLPPLYSTTNNFPPAYATSFPSPPRQRCPTPGKTGTEALPSSVVFGNSSHHWSVSEVPDIAISFVPIIVPPTHDPKHASGAWLDLVGQFAHI